MMRMFCMFDLPTSTVSERKRYSTFRKSLLKEGFTMVQYSVYMRTCPNRSFITRLEKRIEKITPANGHVRVFCITEKQYEDMKVLVGSKSSTEKNIGTSRLTIL